MIPSFLRVFRQPRHQRFRIEPRYYDPVKEEIRERTERIKQEMEGSKDLIDYQPSKISFKRKTKKAPTASMIQIGIAALLSMIVLGWLQFGNQVFYYLVWVSIPIYLVYRLRTLRKKQ